jgi:uncharacterized protein
MTAHYRKLLFTPEVLKLQTEAGSRAAYAGGLSDDTGQPDVLSEQEIMFIATRDSFYMSSIGAGGWPYIQHRGGAPGFVKFLGKRLLGFADFRGNRQYISLGNIASENRVALFFMDYPRRARLKLLGHIRIVKLEDDPDLAKTLIDDDYDGKPERAILIDVEGFDWNCSQHITPRFTAGDVKDVITRLQSQIEALEHENAALKKGK